MFLMSEVPLYRVWGLGAYGGVVVVGKVHEAGHQVRTTQTPPEPLAREAMHPESLCSLALFLECRNVLVLDPKPKKRCRVQGIE